MRSIRTNSPSVRPASGPRLATLNLRAGGRAGTGTRGDRGGRARTGAASARARSTSPHHDSSQIARLPQKPSGDSGSQYSVPTPECVDVIVRSLLLARDEVVLGVLLDEEDAVSALLALVVVHGLSRLEDVGTRGELLAGGDRLAFVGVDPRSGYQDGLVVGRVGVLASLEPGGQLEQHPVGALGAIAPELGDLKRHPWCIGLELRIGGRLDGARLAGGAN